MDEGAVGVVDGPVGVRAGVCRRIFSVGADDGIVGLAFPTDSHLRHARALVERMASCIRPIADAGHFAAAEHGAVDARAAADVDLGFGHATCQDVVVSLGVALARAEDVAHALVAVVQQFIAVAIADARRVTAGRAV